MTFTGLMAAARIRDHSGLAPVDVRANESQNGVRRGDILFNGTSETAEDVALAAVVEVDMPQRTFLNSFCFGYRLAPSAAEVSPTFLAYMFRGPQGRALVAQLAQGFTRYNISKTKLMELEFEVPGLSEQEQIVTQLKDADAYVAAAEVKHRKQSLLSLGVRESLLTGRSRLPGFTAPWQDVQISTLMTPRSERNATGKDIEVLSCTKDRGFVRSLDYFKSQVFSRNLSGYLVIRRGDIGYPSNHVEEGSIGLQELVDKGVVSPIYVVMAPRPGKVDTYFLHRLLKLDSFRQDFAKVTNASVNRRGSLRWPEFSQLRVRIPGIEEQRAIAHVIRDFEAETARAERAARKARDVQTGLSQTLLPARLRAVS
ncbi:restriction endonuclease subunit S [Rhodococcus sp. BS-15]|uniref:restriction endonuclease subunit S n=1 Tax=Rhodococcus sp. BS-15 TaxID=1304954 RepID=UPI000AA31CED|nr:restriction endonuclease subunit S [Rhodococcus sp. BS-15]